MNASALFPSPYIGLDELRGLLRPGRKMFLPDYVANAIRKREFRVRPSEAREIAAILERLTDELRGRLHDEGFEPPTDLQNVGARMPKRERDRAENLALLLVLSVVALTHANDLEEAERQGREGIGWARMAASHSVETHLQIALARCYGVARRGEDEEEAVGCAIESAGRSGENALMVHALDEAIISLISHDKRSRAEELLAEAFVLVESKPDEVERGLFLPRLLLSRGRIAAARKEQGKAIATFREALHLSDAERDPVIHTSILSQLGTAYGGLGDDRKALECYSEMTRIARLSGDAIPCAWGYYRIGELHAILGENAQAQKAFELSLQYAPEHYPLPRYYVYFKQSEICLSENRIEEGIDLCRRILDSDPDKWSPSFAVAVYLHLGILEERNDRLTEAENAFRHSIELCRRTEAIDRSANAKLYLAKVYLKRGEMHEAETLMGEVERMERKTAADEVIVAEACRLLSEIAEGRNDLKEALRHSRAQNELDRGIARRQTEEALQRARVLAEVELLEREAELERERRRQAEQELAQAVLSLKGKNDVLERVESQLHHMLSGIVAEKAREITTSLKQMIEDIDTRSGDAGHPLNYIQGIDQEFFLRLRTRWPGLTRKQERLCALIRAGLTTQEIASILNVSYEGVRALRKRLRKQLGIEAEASLEGLITEV